MTTRRWHQFFSKNPESKKSVPAETPPNRDNEEFGEFTGANTQKLHRSRSGRLKESSKVRLAITKNTFVAPEERSQSAPVISMTKHGMGMTKRDLTKYESVRLRQSLQFDSINSKSSNEPELSNQDSGDSLSDNEVF